MKPPVPLPTEPPFITFYTPTYRRPTGLAKCMASVGKQTAVRHIEHLVFPDHIGHGVVGGLFGRIAWYAEACRGQYVHILADDDELCNETVVAQVMAFAAKKGHPEIIMVGAIKNAFEYPSCDPGGEPKVSQVDLGCYILRRDVWLAHRLDYGHRYEGDYDHALAMWKAGRKVEFLDIDFVEGGATHGRPELDY